MKKIRGLRWQILALMMLGTVVNYIDRNTLGILAPQLKEQLHFSTEQYSFVVSAFQLCYSLMQPVAGYITDLIGLKLGYAMFAMVWGLAASMHALAGGWQSMAFFRGLLGVSEAAAMPSGVKTSTLWFPAKERALATGCRRVNIGTAALENPAWCERIIGEHGDRTGPHGVLGEACAVHLEARNGDEQVTGLDVGRPHRDTCDLDLCHEVRRGTDRRTQPEGCHQVRQPPGRRVLRSQSTLGGGHEGEATVTDRITRWSGTASPAPRWGPRRAL